MGSTADSRTIQGSIQAFDSTFFLLISVRPIPSAIVNKTAPVVSVMKPEFFGNSSTMTFVDDPEVFHANLTR
jgi:hypothetical protein